MRLSQLKKIIAEEVEKFLLESESAIFRRGNKLYITDDEHNEDYYGEIEDFPEYAGLDDVDAGGVGVPFEGHGKSFGTTRSLYGEDPTGSRGWSSETQDRGTWSSSNRRGRLRY
jgi:hypothetical protein